MQQRQGPTPRFPTPPWPTDMSALGWAAVVPEMMAATASSPQGSQRQSHRGVPRQAAARSRLFSLARNLGARWAFLCSWMADKSSLSVPIRHRLMEPEPALRNHGSYDTAGMNRVADYVAPARVQKL